jgi:hypothetical protein
MNGSPPNGIAHQTRSGDLPILLSMVPASAAHRRLAWLVSLGLLVALVISLPFARMPLGQEPSFIAFQQAMLLANDLVTAALLFAQYSVQRSRGLCVLAGGYLFTALIVFRTRCPIPA